MRNTRRLSLQLQHRRGNRSSTPYDNQMHQVFRPVHIDAVIRVCDEAGNVIETHEHAGEFKEP